MSLRSWLIAGTVLSLCIAGPAGAKDFSHKPSFIQGAPATTHYDGVTDDLLTAGLGASGLQSGTAPSVSSPPTVEQLRQLAIYTNYRALVDVSPGDGYGVFFGPTAPVNGVTPSGQGLIAGDETLAYAVEDGGFSHITMMVQVPDSYDPDNGCIVTAPSSGSRGIYGAIATAGEWGLKHGCAVAYTDKGSGTGFDDLQNDLVDLLLGEVVNATDAGRLAEFVAPLLPGQLAAFNAAYPNRFAFKHAHSMQNPERDWGRYVLQSVEFAFYVLNRKFPHTAVDKHNTIVIASSVSNGGGSSLRAIEDDQDHLIDGAAVSEPNVDPQPFAPFKIEQAPNPTFTAQSTPLIDYVTFLNLYEGCAVEGTLYEQLVGTGAGRCAALYAAGLLSSTTLAAQQAEAQQRINTFGFLPEQNFTESLLWFAYVPESISVTYANAYGRFSVADNLCGFSFASTNSTTHLVAPLNAAVEAELFGVSNGIPPTPDETAPLTGITVIDNAAANGAGMEDHFVAPDGNTAGAICLRTLATPPTPGAGRPPINALRIETGVSQILAGGDLHQVPVIMVDGRADDILPPNFVARAYFGLNAQQEGKHSNLHYYEVTNANHLDDIIPFFPTNLIPLQVYFVEAMDLMYAHLRYGAPLPPSQVVHTVLRTSPSQTLSTTNVPAVQSNPGSLAIVYQDSVLSIPQ